MEPPTGFCASLLSFIRFLPFFIGLLLLGTIKGSEIPTGLACWNAGFGSKGHRGRVKKIVPFALPVEHFVPSCSSIGNQARQTGHYGILFCPLICLIIATGNTAIILGLWIVHSFWTYYCVVRAKQFGPILKLVIGLCVLPVLLVVYPIVGILGSIVGGAAYGFLSPIFATLEAVEEGKDVKFYHCLIDGTWSTVEKSCMVVRDVKDVCFHSYFSVMDDLRQKGPPNAKYYEIRLLYIPGALIAAVIGIIVDVPVISFVALCKGPYMLFKGWHRLFHDLIGCEGPFLETIRVPFAGLAILLWPLAVAGAILASMFASFFLGSYAGVVAYQESSFLFGLSYVIAGSAIYDEYSNDILDMPEGSCFPRPQFQKDVDASQRTSNSNSVSRPSSFRKAPSRTSSMKNNNIAGLKSFELLDALFKECFHVGEKMVSEGDETELTITNRPREKFFDWFVNPLLIIKEQIKAENLSASEEDYLCKLVLLGGDAERLKKSSVGPAPESEVKRAELEALARRLQGITKSMSRFPTFKRRFDDLVRSLSDDLTEKHGGLTRSKSAFARLISLKSFKGTRANGSAQGSQHVARDLENS